MSEQLQAKLNEQALIALTAGNAVQAMFAGCRGMGINTAFPNGGGHMLPHLGNLGEVIPQRGVAGPGGAQPRAFGIGPATVISSTVHTGDVGPKAQTSNDRTATTPICRIMYIMS